ncbi:uncharacterized protein BT62DRAFT_993889 [Guyanagaster necrorhizus]|uniref:Tetraspanin n=1 Tax=Guyanagaster necrorhizus TaxID=856835 RepID=A0A9P7VV83_9AGAR|nr:uncharacterized protein BT62DRAFT_993889 [Guyanagaster necrorhizus MCA 3950]KAG7447075.1 hypothetical protein BT62DRAFT_993889 [Guyanagaster necrorhizus MCA 3950]
MRWHHFLCCLPLRLGALIIATLTLAGSALVALGAWFNVHDIINKTLKLSKSGEITMYAIAGVYTLAALISLLGLIGVLTTRQGLVSTFNGLQKGSFIVSLAIGAYSLYLLFSNKYDTSDCISSVDVSADTAKQVCDTTLKISKAAITTIYAIIWLIQFYGLFIVHSYVRELEEERYHRMSQNTHYERFDTTRMFIFPVFLSCTAEVSGSVPVISDVSPRLGFESHSKDDVEATNFFFVAC